MGDTDVYDLFELEARLELPPDEQIQVATKICVNGFNFFGAFLQHSRELLIVSDGIPKGITQPPDVGPVQKDWCLRRLPWFEEENKKVLSLAFDTDCILYVGTADGSVYEVSVTGVLEDPVSGGSTLKLVFQLEELRIVQLEVWHRESIKMILCNGDKSKLAIVHLNNSLPVVVTFSSAIANLELFTNNTGLSCLLVCLENNMNVYCILDDLEIPSYEPENPGKKSLLRKAQDKIMSKLNDEKMNFFNRNKTGKEKEQNQSAPRTANVVVSTSLAVPGNRMPKQYQISNVKFFPIEDVNCRGVLRRIGVKNQFSRHVTNKFDMFDSDFRQTAAIYMPSHITKVFVLNKLFFGIDEDRQCIRISTVHNGTVKEFSRLPMTTSVLLIEAIDHDDLTLPPYAVFIVSTKGIYEVCLRKSALDSCVELLLAEANATMLDIVCTSLNVPKVDVYLHAGDIRAQDGKFAKAVLYYKIAGLGGMKIMAKFGSRGHIPAMLCFYELMEQEQRNKLASNTQDRISMTNLALVGRVEQYLRHGKSVIDMLKNPKLHLRNMLLNNPHYSVRQAASVLSNPQLLWALEVFGQARLSYPEILEELHVRLNLEEISAKKSAFWDTLSADWLTVYSVSTGVFRWFQRIVLSHLKDLNTRHLFQLTLTLLPWRRELHQKLSETIIENGTRLDETADDNVGTKDYIDLFLRILMELLRRKEEKLFEVPNLVIRPVQAESSVAVQRGTSFRRNFKALSVSSNHCACIRNGKIFTWGENKLGRLGQPDDGPRKANMEFPVIVDASLNLRLSFVSVSSGINHNVALTSVGTVFVWGSNAYGQLGLGQKTLWTSRPVPLTVRPNVTIVNVVAGGYHSVGIDHMDRVWTWGWGVHGQLGDGDFESCFVPQLINLPEKIVSASAGHSHTALLAASGNVYTFGCSHFGQLGLGLSRQKVKTPTKVPLLPKGTVCKIVECGFSSTAMVTTTNKLYYCGLNPGTLRTLLSSHKRKEQRNHAAAAGIPQSDIVFDEEKDYSTPVTINTTHLAGEIVKVDVATTHLAALTSAGMVYTWGLGKSGQLVRPDDDQRTLELIEVEDKMFIASDIACGGDCTFVVEKETNKMFGCGFNSSGQLGKLQTDDDSAVMTIKTKKRVVKVRQPSNIYLRLREIVGLPKQSKEVVNFDIEPMPAPSSVIIDQDMLEWFLKTFRNSYEPNSVADMCLEFENHAGAALINAMLNNQENALKFNLCVQPDNKMRSANLIEAYLDNAEKENSASAQQAVRFLRVVIDHWSKFGLLNSDLEKVLVPYQTKPPWNIFLNCALKDIIASADESAKWIASNLTPLFILTAIRESKNGLVCGLAPPTTSSRNPSPTVSASSSSAMMLSSPIPEQFNDTSVNGSSSLEASAVMNEEIKKSSGRVEIGASDQTEVGPDS